MAIKYVTVQEAAAALGKDESTIRRMCMSGVLEASKRNKKNWQITNRSVLALKRIEDRKAAKQQEND